MENETCLCGSPRGRGPEAQRCCLPSREALRRAPLHPPGARSPTELAGKEEARPLTIISVTL